MRVLVTGMGGELGTRVAQLLEGRREVTEVAGFDFVPPRRRLRRATFARIDPRDRDRLVAFVTDFAPDRGRALRRLRAGVPHGLPRGGRQHRGVHRAHARRRGARRAPRARRGPQRPRDLRPGPRPSAPARRGRAARAHHRLRPHLPRGRDRRGRPGPAPRRVRRLPPLRGGRRVARPEPARPRPAAPRGPGPRVRRPAVLAPRPGRRGPGDGRDPRSRAPRAR